MKDHVWGSRADEMREFLFGSPDAAVPAQPSWEQVQKAIFMYVRFVELASVPDEDIPETFSIMAEQITQESAWRVMEDLFEVQRICWEVVAHAHSMRFRKVANRYARRVAEASRATFWQHWTPTNRSRPRGGLGARAGPGTA